MIEEQLAPVRRYTRAEAARALNVPETWLKRWVTERRIPHQREGRQRGVWFTWDDILAIGAMLPELMTNRQASGLLRAEPTAEFVATWAQLRAHRPAPRPGTRRR